MGDEVLFDKAGHALHLATNYDLQGNYTQAVDHYVQGVELLSQYIRGPIPNYKMIALKKQIEKYLDRAEDLRAKERSSVSYRQVRVREIAEDSVGHSYENIFKDVLNEKITKVTVEEPYIDLNHQQRNFVRFCELLVVRAPKLKQITLITKNCDDKFVQPLRGSLKKKNVDFVVRIRGDIHDREILFDDGCKVKMGRGLDIYKKAAEFTLGYYDLNMRPCRACKIDYFIP
uniref:MIT domain-containing protein n=1 Tax=Panagrolaimus sp. JU765 TaxID=591449 RepID=A0AC34PW20_9BILA